MRTLGIDLGLSSTAVVQFDGSSFLTLRANQRVKPAPSLPSDLGAAVQSIMRDIEFSPDEKEWVAIDWDERDIFWGNQRLMAQRKAFMAGYMYRYILEKGAIPLFISPAKVREAFGLKGTVKKEIVQEKATEIMPSSGLLLDEHELDAAILAYVAYQLGSAHTWKLPDLSTSRRRTRSKSRGSSGRTSASGRASST